jgi:hypothetical protein
MHEIDFYGYYPIPKNFIYQTVRYGTCIEVLHIVKSVMAIYAGLNS